MRELIAAIEQVDEGQIGDVLNAVMRQKQKAHREIGGLKLYHFVAVFQQVGHGDAFKEIIDHLIQLFPHGQGVAALCPGTGGGALGSAGNGGEAALGQFQNAAYGIFSRSPV